jgi:hypothetical protein
MLFAVFFLFFLICTAAFIAITTNMILFCVPQGCMFRVHLEWRLQPMVLCTEGGEQRMNSSTGQTQRGVGTIARSSVPRRGRLTGIVVLVIGIIVLFAAGVYGYIESRRVEPVIIAARDIPYGRQISPDDLSVIEMPYYRPEPLRGFTDPGEVVGKYAARTMRANDLLNATMISDIPPDTPVYPNGRQLLPNMVPVPFSLENVGPINDSDLLNIGFIADDPVLCDRARADVQLGVVLPPPPPLVVTDSSPGYACRLMSAVEILFIDGSVAYLHLTPAQSLTLRALQARGVQFWAERYGAASNPLLYMERLDASQVVLPELTRPVSETIRVEPQRLPSYAPPIGASSPPESPNTDSDSTSGDQ